jgi:hypothetical protein
MAKTRVRIKTSGTRHRFHGDPARFAVVADFVGRRFSNQVRYVADVAGGRGMLARLLSKHHGFECDVIDPRGWTMKGVTGRPEQYTSAMADYYDLVIGLHPDQAIREVAHSALIRPVVLVPCCNFWSDEKVGREALVQSIQDYYREHGIPHEIVTFDFAGPYNVALVSTPAGTRAPVT